MPPSSNGCNRCGRRRSSSEFRARLLTRRRAISSRICRCPISWFPGQPRQPDRQPEFVQTPADYLKEASLTRLASQGRALAAEHRATLTRIEREFGVPASVVLAIWGRESGFGRSYAGRDAIRVLATQAYLGRRKDQFREEFLYALKMLQEGQATAVRAALLLGGRHGHDAVPAVGILSACRGFRRRRPARHLEFRTGCARLSGKAARQQGLAAGPSLGLRGARTEGRRLHRRRAGADRASSASG